MYSIKVPCRPEMHFTCLNIAPIIMKIIGKLIGEITSMLMAMKILALSMTYLIWIAITNLAHVNHFEKNITWTVVARVYLKWKWDVSHILLTRHWGNHYECASKYNWCFKFLNNAGAGAKWRDAGIIQLKIVINRIVWIKCQHR